VGKPRTVLHPFGGGQRQNPRPIGEGDPRASPEKRGVDSFEVRSQSLSTSTEKIAEVDSSTAQKHERVP